MRKVTQTELMDALYNGAPVQFKTRQLPAVSKETVGMAGGPLLDGFIKSQDDYGVYYGRVRDVLETDVEIEVGITPTQIITERKENILAVGWKSPINGPGMRFTTYWIER